MAVKSDAPVTVTAERVTYLPTCNPWDPLLIVTVLEPLTVVKVHPVIAVSKGVMSKKSLPFEKEYEILHNWQIYT